MDWRETSTTNCPIARGLDVLGRPWSLLVIRELFLGLRRFDDLADHLGASRPVLSARLRELVADGVVDRVPYREPGQRERYEYRLTDKGRELYPLLAALREWGERHAVRGAPAVVVRHRGCGARVSTVLRCQDGHDDLTARDVVAELGPGALPGRSTLTGTARRPV